MPGPLKNARHERFAQELAKGKSKLGAYTVAGYEPDRGAATRLSANVNIDRRVKELKAKAAEKVIVTVADIAQQLDEDREFARELENPSAAVSASMGKAKVLGLLEDKTKVDITTLGRPLGLGDFYGQANERARSDD
jgi:phage terminase small subunit